MKLKQGSYLKLAKIKMLKEQDLFEYVLGKTTIDPEFLERLPEIKEAIADIYFQWNNIILPKINHAFCHIQSTSRKEFALQAVNYPFKKVLFQLYDRKDLKLLPLKWGEVKTW